MQDKAKFKGYELFWLIPQHSFGGNDNDTLFLVYQWNTYTNINNDDHE